jgi:peptide/nickel transport system permease protein
MAVSVTNAPGATPAPATPTSERAHARRESLKLMLRRPGFLVGVGLLAFWLICAILAMFEVPYTPWDPFDGYDLTIDNPASPSATHLLGTDRLGRDVLSRVLYGARDVFIVAPPAAVIGVVLGTLLGLVMGFYRGIVDDVISRIVEAFLSLPVIMVALLTLVVLGSSSIVVIGVVGILFTPIVARTVRSAVLAESQLDYVTAARLRGESSPFIMVREILPNILGPIIVELTVRFGYAIFTVATLSFLGVGLQPPSPDWGLSVSQEYSNMISGVWWPTVFPALAIASTVVAVNLIADGLQSVLSE